MENKTMKSAAYPIFVGPAKLENFITEGIYCKEKKTGILFILEKILGDYFHLLDENDLPLAVGKSEFSKEFEILFFEGDNNSPNPDTLFLVNNEWFLAGITDPFVPFEDIQKFKVVVAKPQNIGMKKNGEVTEPISFKDINQILKKGKAFVEFETIILGDGDITNMPVMIEAPKMIDNKIIFLN